MRNALYMLLALVLLSPAILQAEPAPVRKTAAHAKTVTLPSIDAELYSQVPLTLSNGVNGKLIQFVSRNPAHFREWFEGELGQEVVLSAQLFKPTVSGLAPIVVMVPGSANIGPHHIEQATQLTSNGIAVLLIDPMYGRSIQTTAKDQAQLRWAAGVFDIFAAIEVISSDPALDARRIGLLGSSRGGFAVITAMMSQIQDRYLKPSTHIVGAFAGYPWCGLQFWEPRIAGNSDLRLFSGDRDDWVSVQQCQDLVHALSQTQSSAQLRILPGAGHAFDRIGMPPTVLPDIPRTTRFPTVYMDDGGSFLDPITGDFNDALTEADFLSHVLNGGFVEQGVTVGSEGDQAEIYNAEMLDFFRRAFDRHHQMGD